MNKLEEQEARRTLAEKRQQKQLIMLDLFAEVRRSSPKRCKAASVPIEQMQSIYDDSISMRQLATEHPRLHKQLLDVSREYAIEGDALVHCLREKKLSNGAFHMDDDLKKYARREGTSMRFDLDDFLIEQQMYPLELADFSILQPVFVKICQKMNSP